MKAVIHKTGEIGEVLGIEKRDGIDYVYFVESGLCLPVSEVGFLATYEQYSEDVSDWSSFRREAAKDILVGLCANNDIGCRQSDDGLASSAIALADELIKQLKQE